MSYSVTWDRDAEAELAACWLAARDRQRLAEACARIDAILATSPEEAGESREPGRRLMYVDPLWVRFEVDASRRRVLVSSVWRIDG
ncbi:MAG TPA: hypothetical protein VF170_01730 [Planctomycetaceae bacterium]